MSRYLGLDASTQSLSAIVIDTETGTVVLDETVSFADEALAAYDSPHGFLPHDDPRVKQANPLMWVEALDLLLERCRAGGYDWQLVDGISVSGQQHGSVYLNHDYFTVDGWSPEQPLLEQIRPLLSRPVSPIWMDSSTSDECAEIAEAAGGDDIVTQISGSRAIERFTGPQIRRFAKDDPEAYARTGRIHLVSSFYTWLLCAGDLPIDYGDAAGMNLLDLASGTWSTTLLNATAPDLCEKLPNAVPSETPVGLLTSYFTTKYGFKAEVPVIAGSGDNPNSLVGMGATAPGTAIISLGTSDTYFAAMGEPHTDPNGYGHVFGNPAGGYMCLICFKNGSLAREEVREEHALDWDAFAQGILEETQPGNDGNTMLYYYVPEITPRVLQPIVERFGAETFVSGEDAAAAARAIVEAQAMSMQQHAAWIGEKPDRIMVTGGASQNPAIRQVLADVLQAEIVPLAVSNSAGLGAALRAAQACGQLPWESLFERFCQPDTAHAATPAPGTDTAYDQLRTTFAKALAPHVS